MIPETKELSAQDVFNLCWHNIIQQGKPSYDPKRNLCLYRGPNGTKCAIGFFLTDKEAIQLDSASFGNSAGTTRVQNILAQKGWQFDALKIAAVLQAAHDVAARDCDDADSSFVRYFQENMRELASEHNLTCPE